MLWLSSFYKNSHLVILRRSARTEERDKEPVSPMAQHAECLPQDFSLHKKNKTTARQFMQFAFVSTRVIETEMPQEASSYLVSGWLESNCLRCWDKSFFSRDNLIHARARPTSVLISLMFWICLRNRSNSKEVNPKKNLDLEKN